MPFVLLNIISESCFHFKGPKLSIMQSSYIDAIDDTWVWHLPPCFYCIMWTVQTLWYTCHSQTGNITYPGTFCLTALKVFPMGTAITVIYKSKPLKSSRSVSICKWWDSCDLFSTIVFKSHPLCTTVIWCYFKITTWKLEALMDILIV